MIGYIVFYKLIYMRDDELSKSYRTYSGRDEDGKYLFDDIVTLTII